MRTTCFVLTAVSLLSVAACTEIVADDDTGTNSSTLINSPPGPDDSDPGSGMVALAIASDDASAGQPVQTETFIGSCTPHKGKTAGWADCVGSGTVRLVIDCKAPQISDYVGPWTTFSGSVTLSGRCTFGINSVFVQIQ
jgi:hypothetical protein